MLSDELRHIDIFPAKIAGTKSVGWLKKAIKEKKSPLFDAAPADHLALWKVSLLIDERLRAALKGHSFVDEEPLPPTEKLSNIFPDLPKRHLHIVVSPPAGEYA